MAFVLFCFDFSGVGWESVLLKGDEAASDATETSSADMTIKVRDLLSGSILKGHLQRKMSLWQTSRDKMSTASQCCWDSLSIPWSLSELARPKIFWNLASGLGNHLKARIQHMHSSSMLQDLHWICTCRLSASANPMSTVEQIWMFRAESLGPTVHCEERSDWFWLMISSDVSGKAAHGLLQLEH